MGTSGARRVGLPMPPQAALSDAEAADVLGGTVGPALHRLARGIDDRPVVIDFRTDWREKVYPMVPAGSSNDDVIHGPLFDGEG